MIAHGTKRCTSFQDTRKTGIKAEQLILQHQTVFRTLTGVLNQDLIREKKLRLEQISSRQNQKKLDPY